MRAAEEQVRSPQGMLRGKHERVIFRSISRQNAISRVQLSEQTGLSGQSVGRVARDLLADGLIEETDIARSSGPGAPPVGLRVRPDGAYAFGFGLERDCLTAVALDLGGNVRWRNATALPRAETATKTLQRIAGEVRALLETSEWRERRDRLCGVGLAAPGPIDLATGTIVRPPNFPGWEHVDAAEELRRALDLPVVIDNESTAAAIGVEWRMPRGHGPFLYCYWGLGIGGGLVFDDDVYRGTTGNAIEIGHVIVDPSGHPCDCGSRGCLEAEASATALLRDAAAHGRFTTLREVVAAARTDPAVAALLTRAAEKLATALVSVLNIVDVNDVVLGGEHFHEVQEVFLPIIRDRIERCAFRRSIAATQVSVTGLGETANAIGAAALVFFSLLPRAARRGAAGGRPAMHGS